MGQWNKESVGASFVYCIGFCILFNRSKHLLFILVFPRSHAPEGVSEHTVGANLCVRPFLWADTQVCPYAFCRFLRSDAGVVTNTSSATVSPEGVAEYGFRHSRESGNPVKPTLDSRFRGNDGELSAGRNLH